MPPILSVRDLRKRYPGVEALSGVDFDVEPGEVVGLLGRNGAGKTTCLRCVLGLVRPSGGSIEVLGRALTKATRALIGATLQEIDFPASLTVAEVLDFVAAHYPSPAQREDVAERFLCSGLLRRRVGALSGGERRKVALGAAFIGNPTLLVLDEPTTGLDVFTRKALWEQIRAARARGAAVLVSSHYLEEVEDAADRLVLIEGGRLAACGTVAEIIARYGYRTVTFFADQELPPLALASTVSRADGQYRIHSRRVDDLVRELVRREVPFRELEIARSALEEVFMHVVKGER